MPKTMFCSMDMALEVKEVAESGVQAEDGKQTSGNTIVCEDDNGWLAVSNSGTRKEGRGQPKSRQRWISYCGSNSQRGDGV